jgi:hypothetical protein
MTTALAILALCALGFFLIYKKRPGKGRRLDTNVNQSPALDAWLFDALEKELASGALGLRTGSGGSSDDERKPLRRTLRGEPDVDVVSTLERTVSRIEIEYVSYTHESHADVELQVFYEDGRIARMKTRLTEQELPSSVREDFQKKAATRVHRTWEFPWR